MKVRFDVESETTVSDSGEAPAVPETGAWDKGKQQFIDKLNAAKVEPDDSLPTLPKEDAQREQPSTPPSAPIRAPRRSPAVRIVDAFGRETTQDEETTETPEHEHDEPKPNKKRPEGLAQPSTPRSRSLVKIVDAMGREVEEVSQEGTSEADIPISHNEALARVKQTIAHMAEDLSEADRSYEALAVDEGRLGALENASKAARNARNKISKSLHIVKNAESDLKSKYKPLRESMKKSQFLPTTIVERRLPWNASLLWRFAIIQLVLFLIMYRLSNIRAKRLFLTTYYDPFYADLYLHAPKHYTFDHSIPSHPSWSISSIQDAMSRSGWTGVISELWVNVTSIFSHSPFEIWGTNARGQAPSSWPPT